MIDAKNHHEVPMVMVACAGIGVFGVLVMLPMGPAIALILAASSQV